MACQQCPHRDLFCGCLLQAKDLFTKEDIVLTDKLCASVNATGIAMFKLEVLGRAESVS